MPRSNCRARISVRDGSFFAGSKLSLRKQLKTVINFMAESSASSSGLRLGVDRETVGGIYYKVRRTFSAALDTPPISLTASTVPLMDHSFIGKAIMIYGTGTIIDSA